MDFSQLSIDALFSALIASIIFVIGWVIQIWVENFKENKRLIQRAKYLLQYLVYLHKPLTSQSKAYLKLSKSILDFKVNSFSLEKNTKVNFHFFSPNLVEDLHLFLEKRIENSFETVKNLSSSINSIQVQQYNAEHNYTNLVSSLDKNELYWNNSINSVLRIHDSLLEDMRSKKENPDEFIVGMAKIVHDWAQQKNDADTMHVFENLVKPLRNFCLDNNEDQRAIKLLPKLHEAVYSFENITEIRNRYHKLFKKDAAQLKTNTKTLSEVVDTINSCL